ncbi:MAG: hypothetical protein HY961_20135, partial [Ignavibacteriae bacterium]|nr:hypothetical protein [Ignavibacteriota bacterium]
MSQRRYGKKNDRALTLWVKLARAFATFSKAADRDIERYGLTTAQFGALECLGHLGPMTIGALCRKQLVSGGFDSTTKVWNGATGQEIAILYGATGMIRGVNF